MYAQEMQDGSELFFSSFGVGFANKQASEDQGYQETLATCMKLLQAQPEGSSSLWRSMKLLRGIQSLVDDP